MCSSRGPVICKHSLLGLLLLVRLEQLMPAKICLRTERDHRIDCEGLGDPM